LSGINNSNVISGRHVPTVHIASSS